jgi:hypothetical protein
MISAYKLFRVRKDGTLGPLFIGRNIVVPLGKWQKARGIRVKGFKFRPGWHAVAAPYAPHLSKKGRVWCIVSLRGTKKHLRPVAQGSLWYTAKWLRVDSIERNWV